MKRISTTVYGITTTALLFGALLVAFRREARAAAPTATTGLMPAVIADAAGPNRVVDEIVVRPALTGSLAGTAASSTAVN
jgi:hypothetical protein